MYLYCDILLFYHIDVKGGNPSMNDEHETIWIHNVTLARHRSAITEEWNNTATKYLYDINRWDYGSS